MEVGDGGGWSKMRAEGRMSLLVALIERGPRSPSISERPKSSREILMKFVHWIRKAIQPLLCHSTQRNFWYVGDEERVSAPSMLLHPLRRPTSKKSRENRSTQNQVTSSHRDLCCIIWISSDTKKSNSVKQFCFNQIDYRCSETHPTTCKVWFESDSGVQQFSDLNPQSTKHTTACGDSFNRIS